MKSRVDKRTCLFIGQVRVLFLKKCQLGNGISILVVLVLKWQSLAHCLETKLIHDKMGTLQFYIPGYQNDPSYPKQKEFLKSTEGNLKWFNLSSQISISTWTGLESLRHLFSKSVYSVVRNNRAAHFINFWLFFLPTHLSRNCIFINFAEKFLPERLFGTNN